MAPKAKVQNLKPKGPQRETEVAISVPAPPPPPLAAPEDGSGPPVLPPPMEQSNGGCTGTSPVRVPTPPPTKPVGSSNPHSAVLPIQQANVEAAPPAPVAPKTFKSEEDKKTAAPPAGGKGTDGKRKSIVQGSGGKAPPAAPARRSTKAPGEVVAASQKEEMRPSELDMPPDSTSAGDAQPSPVKPIADLTQLLIESHQDEVRQIIEERIRSGQSSPAARELLSPSKKPIQPVPASVSPTLPSLGGPLFQPPPPLSNVAQEPSAITEHGAVPVTSGSGTSPVRVPTPPPTKKQGSPTPHSAIPSQQTNAPVAPKAVKSEEDKKAPAGGKGTDGKRKSIVQGSGGKAPANGPAKTRPPNKLIVPVDDEKKNDIVESKPNPPSKLKNDHNGSQPDEPTTHVMAAVEDASASPAGSIPALRSSTSPTTSPSNKGIDSLPSKPTEGQSSKSFWGESGEEEEGAEGEEEIGSPEAGCVITSKKMKQVLAKKSQEHEVQQTQVVKPSMARRILLWYRAISEVRRRQRRLQAYIEEFVAKDNQEVVPVEGHGSAVVSNKESPKKKAVGKETGKAAKVPEVKVNNKHLPAAKQPKSTASASKSLRPSAPFVPTREYGNREADAVRVVQKWWTRTMWYLAAVREIGRRRKTLQSYLDALHTSDKAAISTASFASHGKVAESARKHQKVSNDKPHRSTSNEKHLAAAQEDLMEPHPPADGNHKAPHGRQAPFVLFAKAAPLPDDRNNAEDDDEVSPQKRRVLPPSSDPIVQALEQKLRERRAAERARNAEMAKRSEIMARQQEEARLEREAREAQEKAEEEQRRREQRDERHRRMMEREEERRARIEAAKLNVDPDLLSGKKSMFDIVEERRRRLEEEERKEYEERVQAMKANRLPAADFGNQIKQFEAELLQKQKEDDERRKARLLLEKPVAPAIGNPNPPSKAMLRVIEERGLANGFLLKQQRAKQLREERLAFAAKYGQMGGGKRNVGEDAGEASPQVAQCVIDTSEGCDADEEIAGDRNQEIHEAEVVEPEHVTESIPSTESLTKPTAASSSPPPTAAVTHDDQVKGTTSPLEPAQDERGCSSSVDTTAHPAAAEHRASRDEDEALQGLPPLQANNNVPAVAAAPPKGSGDKKPRKGDVAKPSKGKGKK